MVFHHRVIYMVAWRRYYFVWVLLSRIGVACRLSITIMAAVQSSEKENCCICLGEVENRGQISCDHKFCFDCIHHWSKVTNTCPICKKAFKKITAVANSTEKKRGEKRKGPPKEVQVLRSLKSTLTDQKSYYCATYHSCIDTPIYFIVRHSKFQVLSCTHWLFESHYIYEHQILQTPVLS